jgi:hypothetical protein
MASLMGQQPQQSLPDAQAKVRNVLQQIQSLDEQAGAIAVQFPEFAPSARKVKDALKEGMLKVVSSMSRGTEAPMPPIAV